MCINCYLKFFKVVLIEKLTGGNSMPRIMIMCCFLCLATIPALAEGDLELAQKSQNPVGDLISVPFENSTDFGVGQEDAIVNTLNLKPVYPTRLGSVILINRGILPIIYQEEPAPGEGSEFGLGDLTYQVFFTPAAPKKVILGLGPAFIVPTHTADRLGTDKWSIGPAFVILAKPRPWLFGALVQHFWSVAGPGDEPSVNIFSFQYFINYNFESGWYLTSNPTMTANWQADSGDRWTIPVGGGIGKLVRLGNQPVDFKAQAFWNADKPAGGADWRLQLQCKLLFPK
jgi:hypothetical protein